MFQLPKIKTLIFYGVVVLSVATIAYYGLSNRRDGKPQKLNDPNIQFSQATEQPAVTEENQAVENKAADPTVKPSATPAPIPSQTPAPKAGGDKAPSPADEKRNEAVSAASAKEPAGVVIQKSEITSSARFYPVTVDGVAMEVLAVRASDGSVRTALNTCQVCNNSGKGYYTQTGNTLICQNCKNKFSVDQIEVVRGGCNPVPVLAENKTETTDTIIIPLSYLKSQTELFLRWKK